MISSVFQPAWLEPRGNAVNSEQNAGGLHLPQAAGMEEGKE